MSEFQTQAAKVTSAVEKVIADFGARVETAVSELNKLQAKGVEQAQTVIETATRVTQEQIAFAEQVGGEWRKLVLAATRSATELFTPKA
jgi:hypothetical protein